MELLIFLLGGILILYALLTFFVAYVNNRRAAFFKKDGVQYLPFSITGFATMILNPGGIVEYEKKQYAAAKGKGPVVAITDLMLTAGYYLTDPDIMRNILVKDFDQFVDHRAINTQESNYYLNKMLFMAEGEEWRGIRKKMSPTFTTGKIRRMFSMFERSSERMVQFVLRQVGQIGGDFNFDTVFPKYTADVIASCAFGVDSKCFDVAPGTMSRFEEMGKELQFKFGPLILFKFVVATFAPKVADYFNLEVLDTQPQKYFAGVIKEVIQHRRTTEERQNDFLQLLMDVQEGSLKNDEDTKEVLYGTTEENLIRDLEEKDKKRDANSKTLFDDDHIAANCMVFLQGGFDPSQSLLLFSIYQLAVAQEEQNKLYEEVKGTIEANGNKLSYDSVLEMSYLDMFINETLRLYPPAIRTERRCNKDYRIPGTDSVIRKGMVVGVSIYGVHHDPKYYENPDKFDPERFTAEKKVARHPYTFSPFGHGPRNCIGMRFALIMIKTIIAQIVYNFKIEPSGKTMIPLEFAGGANMKPKGDMWLHVTPRKNL